MYGDIYHPPRDVKYEVPNTPLSRCWRRGFRWGYYGPRQDVVGVPWSLYRTVTAVRNRHAAALPPSSAAASLPQQSLVDRRALQLSVASAAAIVPRVSSRRLLLVYVCLCVVCVCVYVYACVWCVIFSSFKICLIIIFLRVNRLPVFSCTRRCTDVSCTCLILLCEYYIYIYIYTIYNNNINI